MANRTTEFQKDVKRVIEECALIYKNNLLNRYILFGPTDATRPYEVFFPADCFFHLCGIEYKDSRQRVSAAKFLDLACQGRIDANLFKPKYTKRTNDKLSILYSLVRIDATATKIAPLPLVRYGKTNADYIIYNNNAVVMAVRLDRGGSNALVPCSALKDNVPKQTEEKNIGFVLKTEPSEKRYTIIVRPKKGFSEPQRSNKRKVLSKYRGPCMTWGM